MNGTIKFEISVGGFLAALTKGHGTITRKTIVPILSFAMIHAKQDEIQVHTSDLDRELTVETSAAIAKPGSVCLPHQMLLDICKKLPRDGTITVEGVEKNRVAVKCGRSRFVLNTLPAEDFPHLQTGDLPVNFEIEAKTLKGLFSKTGFAMSDEEARYYLNGVHLHIVSHDEKNALRAVATNGHRLALHEIPAPAGAENLPAMIVPRHTVAEILKLDEVGTIKVSASSTKIAIDAGSTTLLSKLIDGDFPNYTRVIPQSHDSTVTIPRADIVGGVDRMAVVTAKENKSSKFTFSGNSLALSCTNNDMADASEEMPIILVGENIEIGFNVRYMAEILANVDSEDVEICMATPAAPALIRSPGDAGTFFILMPMRV